MNRIITIKSNNLEKSLNTKKVLQDRLIESGFSVSEELEKDTELIISIGGDGSFLKAMHDLDFPNIPVIVVNTGHLGFFAEISPSEIDLFISEYKKNNVFVQDVSLLRADICTKDTSVQLEAINEVVIKSVCSRTLHLDINVNSNKIQTFSGDGVLISTPTGSTAYNYSAGGAIIDPSLDIFQLTPLSPMNTIAYRSFTSSIVLNGRSDIEVLPEYRFENSILIVVDGVEHSFSDITNINIRKSKRKIKFLRLNGFEFWKKVSQKFL